MKGPRRTALLGIGMLATVSPLSAAPAMEISVRDDGQQILRLTRPAERIISLAPHATELLFAAGAGSKVVAVVDYSDFPPPALDLPRVGSGGSLDLERIVALRPDLIIGWQSGNSAAAIARLRALGFPIYVTEPRRLEDIAHHIRQLGILTGSDETARRTSERFLAQYLALRAEYAGRAPVRVFYQLLDASLMTVNDLHLISEVLRLCGGVNVFGSIGPLAGRVEREAVLAANPAVILAGGPASLWREWRERWHQWPSLTAVRHGHLYRIDADVLHRHSPRVLDGARAVCAAIDAVRRSSALR